MKFKFSSLAAATLVGLAAASAQATTTDLGAIAIGTPVSFAGYVADAGVFVDVFTFTLPDNGGSGYSVANIPLLSSTFSFDTVFSTLTVVSNADGILYNADDVVIGSVTGTNAESLSLALGATAAGSYYLTVSGLAKGDDGGLYSAAISVAAAPVPEPETVGLMLAGLGAVGFLSRRRRAD